MSDKLKCPKCGETNAVFYNDNGLLVCWKCDYREEENISSCPNGHGELKLWEGKLRCWTCGYPDRKKEQALKPVVANAVNTNPNNYNNKNEIGFWDRVTGKGVEKLVDEYSEVYGEILLGMHRELTTQKKKLSDFENDIKEIEKLNDIFGKDTNVNTEGKYIIELAKRLAENIAKVNNDNLKVVNDTKCLIEGEFKKISQSISGNSKTINQKIQFAEEKLSLVNSSISKQTFENDKKFSFVLEKADTNKSLLAKSLNWNRAFIILTFITSLTILGILLWKTNLLL